MNKISLLSIAIVLIIGSCGVPQKDYDKLKAENEKLKQELEDCQFGADKLLSKAKSYFEEKEYDKCKQEINTLLEKHSGSNEAKEAKVLFSNAENELKKIAEAEKKAEEERIKKEKQRIANATKKLKKSYDDMSEITWYEDKTSGGYKSKLYAYIGKKENSKPWLRIYIRYYADDWLFIESYQIKVDGKSYRITEKEYGEIKTDNSGGSIWETLDRKVDSETFEIIKAIANGKNVKIRYNGKDYYKDRTITSSEKLALRNVLDAYEALGGTMK